MSVCACVCLYLHVLHVVTENYKCSLTLLSCSEAKLESKNSALKRIRYQTITSQSALGIKMLRVQFVT